MSSSGTLPEGSQPFTKSPCMVGRSLSLSLSLSHTHTHTHTHLLVGLAMAASILRLSADMKYYLVPPVTHLLTGRWSIHLSNNTWSIHNLKNLQYKSPDASEICQDEKKKKSKERDGARRSLPFLFSFAITFDVKPKLRKGSVLPAPGSIGRSCTFTVTEALHRVHSCTFPQGTSQTFGIATCSSSRTCLENL